jgi:hypothetical protein
MDPEALARLRDLLTGEHGLIHDESNPVDLFDSFLHRIETEPQPQTGDDEFFEELVQALSQLAIDDNGGDPDARKLRGEIYALLESALAGGRLDAPGLMLTGKVLSDSGWLVPDSLKRNVVELLDKTDAIETGGDLASMLSEIAEGAQDDPFAAYDALNSVLAAFPAEVGARMVAILGDSRNPVLLHTLAGFAMHREAPMALAAIGALRRIAGGGKVESLLVERLVRMRPWLPTDRQGPLDEAIRALRAQALAPVEASRPKSAKAFVLACDGSGAGGALASLKSSDGWRFVAAMTKPSGIEDVLSLEGLSKREVDMTVTGMRDSVLAAAADVAGLARYLQLGLGESIAAQAPPPFKFIAFVENLGLGPLSPRLLTPAELIAEILAGLPDARKDAAATARAHEAALGGSLEDAWFEAGEPVERLLAPIRGAKARIKAVLSDYLPLRRAFWARNCAVTAFVLGLDRSHGALGEFYALVGRDIAAGAALDRIPLMRQVAATTVAAFESRQR